MRSIAQHAAQQSERGDALIQGRRASLQQVQPKSSQGSSGRRRRKRGALGTLLPGARDGLCPTLPCPPTPPSHPPVQPEEFAPCIFEYIYISRPDSILNNIPVYTFQLGLGTRLAKAIAARGWDIDLVCPVPDGSRPAAIQISAEMALPYREGLVKNRYVGRTFIMPDQRMREVRGYVCKCAWRRVHGCVQFRRCRCGASSSATPPDAGSARHPALVPTLRRCRCGAS